MTATAGASPPARWSEEAGPMPTPLGDAVREHARVRPGSPAVRDDIGSFTYAELVSRALAIASALDAAGTPADVPVAVCGIRDRHMVLGVLAVRLSGRPYFLMDIGQPTERGRIMLKASGAQLAIATSPEGRKRFADFGSPATVLDITSVAGSAADLPARREDIAYLCFTSGSTGRPKGVRVPAWGIDAFAEWYVATHEVTSQDCLSQVASASFDAWGLEVWPALRGGAELVVASAETVRSPSGLAAWLIRTGVSVCFLPTPLAVEVLQELPGNASDSRLRAMLIGGDRLVSPPAEQPPFRLFNNYGPTECAIVATATEIMNFGSSEAPPIGVPLPYIEAEVRRPDGSRCDVDEPGELLLAGPALSPGYLDDADTEASFIDEPAPNGAVRRLYRTGDMVRADGDGVLHFVGRVDNQVKVNGVRIELGEVEAALTSHPAVVDAAVVVQTTPAGESRLVGFVVGDVEPAAVRESAAQRLPQVMRPAAVVVLDRLPVTLNGKIDREVLQALDSGHAPGADGPGATGSASDDELVAVVRSAWVQLLGVEAIEPDDDFFDLGGDSLRSMRLVRRLGKEGIRMVPEDLYRSSTFKGLLETLSDRRKESAR
ncbi:amino acid adenylation domain-containing protein [Actinoplanes sp. NPDC020271]|uniref:amino acid adenylation domain-containing protein n=1 Tax=Actinoplanes sp. NPDC020271 TaxID=3363896 RepID=UPI00379EA12F